MLKSRTWLTDYNDILTDIGWLPISKALKAKYLLGVNKEGLVVKTNILEINKISNYIGKIDFVKNKDICLSSKHLHLYKNCIWRVDGCIEKPKTNKIDYEGDLYNIVTRNNTFIFRSCNKNLYHLDDYTVSLCLVK